LFGSYFFVSVFLSPEAAYLAEHFAKLREIRGPRWRTFQDQTERRLGVSFETQTTRVNCIYRRMGETHFPYKLASRHGTDPVLLDQLRDILSKQ
jgi:hypothetical protein